jgi:hypothetical protein
MSDARHYLRRRAATYLAEARETHDEAERTRLIMMAAHCQELIAEHETDAESRSQSRTLATRA